MSYWHFIVSTPGPQIVVSVFIAATLSVLVLWGRKPRTPPGPRGWPFIGNALDIPTKHPWKVYSQWSEDFHSDILSLQLPGASLIILNSAKAVQDLLVKRSAMYSDRPRSTMLSDLMGMSWVFGLMQYGNQWKQHRKAFRRDFETDRTTEVRSHELLSVRRLLRRLLNSSVNYARDLQLTTGDAILSVTYGISPKSEDDYFIRLAESLVSALVEVSRAPYLVDMFPIFKIIPEWFPGSGFKQQAKEWRRLGVDVRAVPFDHVKSEIAKGTAVSSIASHFLASLDDDNPPVEGDTSEDLMRNILAEAYLGGAGATVGTLCSFVLAMALYPDVQKTAQAAVDQVLKRQRFPDFSDYGHIPYLDALVNEVLRWNPGAPLGLFHAVNKDDYYNGYLIPKGSMIVPNVWAILHDEAVYGANPEEFSPERFLTPDNERDKRVPDTDAAFGFGRRMCPGRVMGREMLWITAASILATFDISDAVDQEGKPLDPALIEYTNSMSSRPPYFDCSFKLRSFVSESMVYNGVTDES
ncbi:cytochrome P450 [Collybia nuda]|uniref:Cytochrome P450 n=1 Tax=Collybia nuda TaxID=64659 RepID=A0A9P6CB95_9AGAR|nr:cytochrome P450 [Collybia nuda]